MKKNKKKCLDKICIDNITSEAEFIELKYIIYEFNLDSRILNLRYPGTDRCSFLVDLSKPETFRYTIINCKTHLDDNINRYSSFNEFKESLKYSRFILRSQEKKDIVYKLFNLGYVDYYNKELTIPEDEFDIMVYIKKKEYEITSPTLVYPNPFTFITWDSKVFVKELRRITDIVNKYIPYEISR